jgi:hypothetical protein
MRRFAALRTRRVPETISTQPEPSIGDMGTDETYISQRDWLVPLGRPDLIDPVADEHERRPNGQQPGPVPQDHNSG